MLKKLRKLRRGPRHQVRLICHHFDMVKIGAFPRCCPCGCIQKFEWPEEALELRRQTYQHVRPSLGWFKGLILSREIMSNIWLCYIVASFSNKQVLYSIQCRCSPILKPFVSKTIQRCHKYFHFLLLRPLSSVLQRLGDDILLKLSTARC